MKCLRIQLNGRDWVLAEQNEVKYRRNEPDFIGKDRQGSVVEAWMTLDLDYTEIRRLMRE